MVVCLLCLKNKRKLIKIFSKKGLELKCPFIIAKHFWFQLNELKDFKESICLFCWNTVEEFHHFYQKIAKVHDVFETVVLDLKSLNLDKPLPKIVKPDENSQQTNVHDDIFDPDAEVKIEANCLALFPQVEIIENQENVTIKNQNELIKEYSVVKKSTNKSIKLELNSSSEDDSETEIPLSKLIHTLPKALPKTDAKYNKQAIKFSDKELHNKSEEPSQSGAYDDANIFSCKSENDEEPNKECINREKKLNQSIQKRKEYDDNIANFFQKLQCTKCEFSYTNFDDLKNHFSLVHKSGTLLECCSRKINTRRSLSEHALFHLHPNHKKCSYPDCDKIFEEEKRLVAHQKTHKTSIDKTKIFHCDQCPKTFSAKNNLKAHQLVKHLPKSDYKFPCAECKAKFPTRRRYKDHMRVIHGLENPLICEKCGKRVRNAYSLKRHMFNHSEIPWSDPVQCDICGKWLKQSNSLRQHKTWVHNQRSEEKCNLCGKTFSNVRYLESHILHMHQGERKFQCTMCDKAFKKQRDLKTHTNLHTKEVVYKCDLCFKTFNQKTSLLKHKSNYHMNNQLEAPDPVQCKICNAWLKTHSGLKSHIKIIHEGSVGEHCCYVCSHKSVNAMALRRHLKRNHGIKSKDQKISITQTQQNENILTDIQTGCALQFENQQTENTFQNKNILQ